MKERKNIIILVVGIILVVALGLYIFASNLTDWNYNLDKEKKSPYGTYLFYELMKDKYGKNFTLIQNSVLESFRKLDPQKQYNYVFIQNEPFYDTATVDTLMKFAEKGNTVFLAIENVSGYFRNKILSKQYHLGLSKGYNYDDSIAFAPPDTTTEEVVDEEYAEDESTYNEEDTSDYYYDSAAVTTVDTSVAIDSTFADNPTISDFLENYNSEISPFIKYNFVHPSLHSKKDYAYFYRNKTDTIPEHYLYFKVLNDTFHNYPLEPEDAVSFAAYQDGKYGVNMNMAVLKHGKGQVIVLLTTVPFTNYFMRTPQGIEFTEKVISHLPNKNTLWDDISQIPVYEEDHGSADLGESPLYFILKKKQLRWAWYLLLSAIIIYALFRAKRRQQIIPIIEPKQNTSLQYVETIGQLYFYENEHIEIAVEMRNQLLNYIRSKYYLKTNEIDDAFFAALSLKSAIEEDKLRDLFAEYEAVVKIKSIDNNKLHALNNKTEYFYKHCK